MKKVIKLKESDLVKLVKGILNEEDQMEPEMSNNTFDQYGIQKLTEEGFRKVSNTLYKKDVSPAKTLKVSLYVKGCSAEYPGFTFFVNDKAIYQGCPDACWVWWDKYKLLFN